LVGGIAVYIGMFAGMLCLPHAPYALLGAGLLILSVGVWDDLHDISPRLRLCVQLAALCVMIFAGKVMLDHFGPLFGKGDLHLRWFAIPLTLFGAATLINAMNMVDGLDGLAGSLALTAFLSLCGVAWASGLVYQTAALGVVSAAILAFLCFNFPFWPGKQAGVFMGDAGSTLIGLILAWFTIDLSQQAGSIAPPAIMLWIVALPIMDLAVVFIQRLKQGRSPFKPGKEHIQNVLLEKGFSRTQTVWVILGMALLGQAIAWSMMIAHVPDPIVLGSFLGVFMLYWWGRGRNRTS
jgi:UDP-GlcNAc:undecaprenyl-phosphate GlcNAc-1-phosphate transferase